MTGINTIKRDKVFTIIDFRATVLLRFYHGFIKCDFDFELRHAGKKIQVPLFVTASGVQVYVELRIQGCRYQKESCRHSHYMFSLPQRLDLLKMDNWNSVHN